MELDQTQTSTRARVLEEAEVEEAPMVLRDLFCLKYHQPKIEQLKYTVT